MPDTTATTQLQELEERLADTDPPPTTTLEILGEATRERYWEDLLVYFLDPTNPHGFGTDVLEAFLNALAAHDGTTFSPTQSDLEQVAVQSQVPTGDGPFDIFLWCDDAWYVVIELKVAAAETGAQTERYAQASELGDLRVSDHSGASEYVYLAPSSAPSSTSETFADVSWEHVVPHLEDVLQTSHGQYLSKSRAQFADYLDTIHQTVHMDESSTISEETKLYTEYSDIIDRLVQAHDNDRATVFNHLQTRFFADLEDNEENWTINNRPTTYINFAKDDWDDLLDGVRIEYELHVHLDREHPDIRLRLDIEHGEKEEIRDQFRSRLSESDVAAFEADGWEIVDASYAYLAKSVPLDLEQPDDSIQTAIQDLHDLRPIVEPHLDAIVAESQPLD